MSSLILNNLLRFVVLTFLQVFLFKNIGYYNLAVPFPYILFMLLLPIGIPNLLTYLICFGSGLLIDAFYDTLGIHAAACTALAFVRVFFIDITVQQENHELYATPNISEMSFRWFFIYALVLTLIHHTVLFILEAFTFVHFQYTLISIFFSCIFTVLLMLLSMLLFFRRKRY